LGLKEDILFLEIVIFLFGGSSEAAMGGAQRPVGRGNEPKKTGARSARARTRGQNPLVQQRKGCYGQNFGELATEGGDGSADDTRGGSGGVPHLPVAQLQEQDQEKLHTSTLGGR
jgi:hypothetical protein